MQRMLHGADAPAPLPAPDGKASEAMCHYCFHVLESRLRGTPSQPPPDTIPNVEAAIFVSYTKLPGSPSEELRGCKGTHALRPLHEQLRRFALCSALEDTRFPRISLPELPRLSCTVSVLDRFEQIHSCYDWEVGTHGLKIEFSDPADNRVMYYGTFLPHVAGQMGWTREQTVENLVIKAGYHGPLTPALLRRIYVERFCDSNHCSPFSDYDRMARRRASAEAVPRALPPPRRSSAQMAGMQQQQPLPNGTGVVMNGGPRSRERTRSQDGQPTTSAGRSWNGSAREQRISGDNSTGRWQ
eukprot:TRINITY_DN22295_c0_g1_i1.p1 TRINITY_DN22295_c0_g1~~TRINITY_DN22295_c0_g1_i1.p1  ORF type:complete len:299 (+),score=69.60 TRINITY_DN22295_c0_g1_i1:161-1057(+)